MSVCYAAGRRKLVKLVSLMPDEAGDDSDFIE